MFKKLSKSQSRNCYQVYTCYLKECRHPPRHSPRPRPQCVQLEFDSVEILLSFVRFSCRNWLMMSWWWWWRWLCNKWESKQDGVFCLLSISQLTKSVDRQKVIPIPTKSVSKINVIWLRHVNIEMNIADKWIYQLMILVTN